MMCGQVACFALTLHTSLSLDAAKASSSAEAAEELSRAEAVKALSSLMKFLDKSSN